MKQILILFLCSFLLTILITVPIAKRLALYFRIVDIPDSYLKRHQKTTPYLGGAALFVSFWITLSYFFDFLYSDLYGLSIGTCLIFLAGLADDIFIMTPFQKFVCQIIASAILVFSGFFLDLNWPLFLDRILSVCWIITLMNAFNLVDVMDGLATVIGMCVSCGLLLYAFFFQQEPLCQILVILLGGQLAFFYYNRPRATIYLGDAGSMLIGTIIAVVALKLEWGNVDGYLGYLIAPIIVGIPLIEIVCLITIRRLKEIPFYNGSRDHYIHYLKHKNWSDGLILSYTATYSLLLFLFSLLVAFSKMHISLLLGIGVMLLALWVHVVFFKNSTFIVKK